MCLGRSIIARLTTGELFFQRATKIPHELHNTECNAAVVMAVAMRSERTLVPSPISLTLPPCVLIRPTSFLLPQPARGLLAMLFLLRRQRGCGPWDIECTAQKHAIVTPVLIAALCSRDPRRNERPPCPEIPRRVSGRGIYRTGRRGLMSQEIYKPSAT